MDAVDRQILAELQQGGRVTLTELAERVGLSISPATVDSEPWNTPARSAATTPTSTPTHSASPSKLWSSSPCAPPTGASVDAFEQAVTAVPHVRQAQRLFGDPDYLLRVIAADLPAFQQLYDDRLATLPGVQRLSSTLVMKSVVENRALPL